VRKADSLATFPFLESQPSGALIACPGLYRDSFTLFVRYYLCLYRNRYFPIEIKAVRLKTGVNIYERLGADISCVKMHAVQMWLC